MIYDRKVIGKTSQKDSRDGSHELSTVCLATQRRNLPGALPAKTFPSYRKLDAERASLPQESKKLLCAVAHRNEKLAWARLTFSLLNIWIPAGEACLKGPEGEIRTKRVFIGEWMPGGEFLS